MSTMLMSYKKLTITVKRSILEFYSMGIVVAIKSKLKLLELKTVTFFSIAFGFLNFADHPIVHVFISFFQKIQKGTRTHACLSAVEHLILGS